MEYFLSKTFLGWVLGAKVMKKKSEGEVEALIGGFNDDFGCRMIRDWPRLLESVRVMGLVIEQDIPTLGDLSSLQYVRTALSNRDK